MLTYSDGKENDNKGKNLNKNEVELNELYPILSNFSKSSLVNWLDLLEKTKNDVMNDRIMLRLKIMSFYLYKTWPNPDKLHSSLKGLLDILEEKFNFFKFYENEFKDLKKRKEVVIRFLKLLDLEPEIRRLLSIIYKSYQDLNFLLYFIKIMVYSYDNNRYKRTS